MAIQDATVSAFNLSPEDADWQRKIIQTRNAWAAYSFAHDIEGADIQALQRVITEHGDGWTAYCFAHDIADADIASLQKVVLDIGNREDAYRFARDIKGANIEALQNVVLNRGDGWAAYWFAKDIMGADLDLIHMRLMKLNSTGDDIDIDYGEGAYLSDFKRDTDIQSRLKEQMSTNGEKKHRPS